MDVLLSIYIIYKHTATIFKKKKETYIYIYTYIYNEHMYLVQKKKGSCVFLVPSFSRSHVWFSLLS